MNNLRRMEYDYQMWNPPKVFAGGFETQLPKNMSIIRVVADLAFSALLALKFRETVAFWPIVFAGVAIAVRNVYSQLFVQDPLVEAFHKIVGGKDKFEQLPSIDLQQKPQEKISDAIQRLNWDKLENPIAQAKTLDGRNVIIVTGYKYHQTDWTNTSTYNVLAFIEKIGPYDVPRVASYLPEFVNSLFHAIFLVKGNTFGRTLSTASKSINAWTNECRTYEIRSSISAKMANEFVHQLTPKPATAEKT